MEQNQRLEPNKELPSEQFPERFLDGPDVSIERVYELQSRINELLNSYKIMPDSFLMPEDYENFQRLQELKKNKLRTVWFFLSFVCLDECFEALGRRKEVLEEHKREFNRLQQKEADLCADEFKTVVLDQSNPVGTAREFKKIKRQYAPQLVAEKIVLIEAIDFTLRSVLKELSKGYEI